MPQLACNPILVTITSVPANTWVTATLTVTSVGRSPQLTLDIQMTIRANSAGKVEKFDISPIVAGVCRQNFVAEVITNGQYQNYNQWSYKVSVGGSEKASGNVLFGAGEVEAAYLDHPYLLRRNTSTIHLYDGLPGSFAQLTPMQVYLLDYNLVPKKIIADSATLAVIYPTQNINVPTGKYYLVHQSQLAKTLWNDTRVWNDSDVWKDFDVYDLTDAVVYPLHVHPSPADCIRGGGKVYVRYWNSRGTWSYAMLDVQHNDLEAKTSYADSWRLDATPVNGRIYGDRVQTDKEMTYSIVAGRDGLDRLDVDELRDMQRSYCVQVWDIDRGAWRDCYVKDATTRNAGGHAQEITFTIEMPHEYTFTR